MCVGHVSPHRLFICRTKELPRRVDATTIEVAIRIYIYACHLSSPTLTIATTTKSTLHVTMPPKRRNNAASTSRARKRTKLEEEDSDESYHSSGDTDAGSDAVSDAESSYSEPPRATRKRGKREPAKPVAKSRATKAIASPTHAITSSTEATASSTASVRDGRVAVTLEVLLEQPLDIVLEVRQPVSCDVPISPPGPDFQLSHAIRFATSDENEQDCTEDIPQPCVHAMLERDLDEFQRSSTLP